MDDVEDIFSCNCLSSKFLDDGFKPVRLIANSVHSEFPLAKASSYGVIYSLNQN